MQQKHYIFAYGSLIHPLSRSRTLGKDADAVPVFVYGLTRSWSYNCRNTYTAVAVSRAQQTSTRKHGVNGVLFPLKDPDHDLQALDQRELNYTRTRLSLSQISIKQYQHNLLGNEFKDLHNGNCVVWVYELGSTNKSLLQYYKIKKPLPILKTNNTLNHQPSLSTPIPQSYLDCILDGCLQFGQEFALEFISTTTGWKSGPWLNDRQFDSRIIKYIPDSAYNYKSIDSVLWTLLPSAMASRVAVNIEKRD